MTLAPSHTLTAQTLSAQLSLTERFDDSLQNSEADSEVAVINGKLGKEKENTLKSAETGSEIVEDIEEEIDEDIHEEKMDIEKKEKVPKLKGMHHLCCHSTNKINLFFFKHRAHTHTYLHQVALLESF